MPTYTAAETELLLSVCRRDLGAAREGDGIPIESDRWSGLVAAAFDHGLIGPLQSYASTADGVPENFRCSIRSAAFAQAVHNFQLAEALLEILHSFRACTIEVVVLKGPAVALIAYQQIATREFTDLDLLVRPEDLHRARVVLGKLGYRQVSEDARKLRGEKDIQFVRDIDGVLVELHWALNAPTTRFPLELTGIWTRLQTVYFQNQPIHTLALEDTLLALCIHGSKHDWASLKWLFDIARILKNKGDTLDWSALLERCETVGCTRTLLVSSRLAFTLFAVDPPDAIAMQMTDVSVRTLAERFTVSLIGNRPLSQPELLAYHIQIHDRFWDRLFVAVTMNVPDLPRLLPIAVSPITSGPLRFLTRPVRLLHVYGATWLRAVLIGR